MNTINLNMTESFFWFKNGLCLVMFITKYGVISAIKSAHTNKKEKKFSRSQENEVRRMILLVKRFLFIQ
jgi:hypothetical protein